MHALITDSQFNSLALVLIAVITIVPTTLSAYWSRKAKNNSADAASSSAEAAAEVRTNGGMTDPNPNVNDHIKYQTEMLEKLMPIITRQENTENMLEEHLTHSKIMDQALSQVYFKVMTDTPIDESGD